MRTDWSAPTRALLAAGMLFSAGCNGTTNGDGGGLSASPSGTPTDSPEPAAPPVEPSNGPSTPAPGGQATIPVDAVYAVQIQGRAGTLSGYGGFTLPAEVYLVRTIEPSPATTNGVNPSELAIFTAASPASGTHGALHLGTNTSLTSIRGAGSPGAALDVAFVTWNGAGRVEAILDRDGLAATSARPGSFNRYGVASGAPDDIVAGTVTVRLDGSGQSVSGTIQLGGSSGTQYSATFAGNRIR